MASVNKTIHIGNVGREPELKYTPNGKAVCNFSIACNEAWKGDDGNKQERTEWIKVVAWGKLAENCGKLLSKGKQVYIEGRLQTREWNDKDGNKRYSTEVVANTMQLLSNRGSGDQDYGQPGKPDYKPVGGNPEYEDVPF